MIGDESFYFINKWLGLNTHSLLVQSVLDFFYKTLAGFPKLTKKDEIIFTQQRVAYLDWKAFSDQMKSMPCPVFLTYSTDDHLIQSERFEELTNVVKSAPGNDSQVVVFSDGGHNIQKTKASEISREIKVWLEKMHLKVAS